MTEFRDSAPQNPETQANSLDSPNSGRGRERWYNRLLRFSEPPFKPATMGGALIGGVTAGSINILATIPGMIVGGLAGEYVERRIASKKQSPAQN